MAISDRINLLLLIELAAVVIAASAFLFYWNRLLASVTAFLIRLYTWRYCNAYIIIGSLQISPLAGRISFRNVEYHSSNLSVRALHGHITWRYWKIRIRQEPDSQSNNTKRNKLPCRISVFAEGVEAFIYNRTPAYDAIVERMNKHENDEDNVKETARTSDDSENPIRARLRNLRKTSTRGSSSRAGTSEIGQRKHAVSELPAQVKPVTKVPSDGVDWFREALPLDIRIVTGSVILGSDATPMVLISDFGRAEGTLEVTDSRSPLDLYKMTTNITFHDAKVLTRTNVDYSGSLLAHGKKAYDELLKKQPDLTSKPPSAISVFTGFHFLAKQFAFLHDPKFSSPPVAGLPTDRVWKGLARYRQTEDGGPQMSRREEREYAKVTSLMEASKVELTYYADTPGNGGLAPEYGMDIVIHKGNVRYGPWADRQRAFAPSLFFDSETKPRLKPGDTRVHTTMVVHLLLEDETFLRIPTREPSKLSMMMPTPLRWNAQRDWGMDVTLDTPSISLLRDHVTLISDLAKDWSSGTTTGDYHHFVPMHYNFRVSLINYAFHMYINDYNIVDAPWSRDSNENSTVPFTIDVSDAKVELCVPKWDTHRAFGADRFEAGRIGQLTVSGSYLYYSAPRPDHQETLNLHMEALGWVLRRMFSVKENYFGSFTQFRTMQEYLEKFDHDPDSVGDPVVEKYRPGRSDPFAVFVTMNIEESLILMSDEIYDCKRGIVMPIPQLQMNLKSVEHFMELSLESPPTYVAASDDLDRSYKLGAAPLAPSEDAIFIEGIELKANRLFGPQPHATTYLCLWEATIPRISAFLNPVLLSTLGAVGKAVGYTFEDPDNAPASIFVPKSPPDAPRGLCFDTSTLATRAYSSMFGVLLPALNVDLLHRFPGRKWHVAGNVSFGITMDVYKAPTGWQDKVAKQQRFLREQDEPTGRIWYMYRGPKQSGTRHVDGLYLPQPMEDVLADDGSSKVKSEQFVHAMEEDFAQSSSAGESDSDADRQALQAKLRRRSRALARGAETGETSSIGIESDSTSASSATTEESVQSSRNPFRRYTDMADVLALKLGQFRLARGHRTTPPKDTVDSEASPTPGRPRTIENGTVIKVTVHAAGVSVDPESLGVLTSLSNALAQQAESHERRLDALLVGQVQAIENEKEVEEPTIIDVRMPSISLRAKASTSSIVLLTQIVRTHCSLCRYTLKGKQSVLDAAVTSESLVISIMTSDAAGISLRDVAGISLQRVEGLPISQAAFHGLEVGVHQTQGVRLHIKTRNSETHTVTPNVATLLSFAGPWRHALNAAKFDNVRPVSDARILYLILKAAVETDRASYLPAFAYERAYGLHVQDQRNLRRQTGWWLLARFRDWLNVVQLDPIDPQLSEGEMAEYIIEKLLQVEDTVHEAENMVREQYFIKAICGPHAVLPTSNKKRDPPIDLFIYVDRARLSHHGQSTAADILAQSFFGMSKVSFGLSKATTTTQGRPVSQTRIIVTVREIDSKVQDSILALTQTILRAIRGEEDDKTLPPSSTITPIAESASVIIFNAQIGSMNIDIIGGGLRLHLDSQQIELTDVVRKTAQLGPKLQRSITDSAHATCGLLNFTLLQRIDSQPDSADRVVIVLRAESLTLLIFRYASTRKPAIELKSTIGLKEISLDSRPQLRAYYAFVQEWKKSQLPFEEMRSFLAKSKPPIEPNTPSHIVSSLDVTVESLHFQVRAAKSLWLRWDMGKIFGSRQAGKDECRVAVRTAPQVVGVYTSNRRSKAGDSSALRLPSVTVVGNTRSIQGRTHVLANIDLGFFTGVLKPAILDRLLSLHQRLDADISEVIEDWRGDVNEAISKHREKDQPTVPTATRDTPSVLFDVHIGAAGVRFGLRADDVATTLLFEALVIKGRATNRYNKADALHWRAKVDHFGVSLGHLGSQTISTDAEPLRKQRTAYMVLDAEAQEIPATEHSTSQLLVNLSRVHTVMHVEALSELSDLIRSWSSDLRVLREHRAAEVAEVKHNTTKMLKSFENAERVEHSEVSWFANRLFSVEVSGIGVAIPLVEGAALGEMETTHVPAVLYSIRVISYQNRRNETARFKVHNMALQFIQEFDQSSPEHFTGDFYGASNAMTLPSIESEMQMSSTHDTWQLSAHWSATDFKLTLAPDVADAIFKLMDLFQRGKERISNIEEQYRAEMVKHAQESVSAKYDGPATPVLEPRSQRILVKMSFTFNSGIVELHRELSDSERKTMTAEAKKGRSWHDTVVLPTVSVWLDYVGPKRVPIQLEEATDGLLLLNFSEPYATIDPAILRTNVESNRKASEAFQVPSGCPNDSEARPIIRCTPSKLRLSCGHDSNAYVDLKWESGGFMASALIGGGENHATVAGTVSGVTAYLRHEFAEEGRSCIEAGAKDMAFSVAYCPASKTGHKGLSIVLDTQLSAQFRLEQFSAWLTFAAVWIESAPKLDLPPKSTIVEAATSPAHTSAVHLPKLAIAALVRFRSVDFDTNIGVTNARLEMTPIVLRTLSNGEKAEVNLDIGVTQITARGDISGEMRSESLIFRTTRQSSRASANSDPTVLSMSIDAGDLVGSLSLQELKVFRFHLEPAIVTLADDWRSFTHDPLSQVFLSFAVKAGVFRSIVRVLAIPTLLNKFYSVSNTIESQERMASQRSRIYQYNQLRKSTDPSPMTAVILQTARKAGQSLASTTNVKTAQTMRFDLGGIDIGVFNAPVTDEYRGDFYRFTIGKVEADLKRQSSKGNLRKRDLNLLVTYARWDTSDGPRAARDAARKSNLKEMIESASRHGRREIASLPLLTMTMDSLEEAKPPVLVYDFDLIWGEGDGDIAIVPYFFEQAFKTFNALIQGLDREQVTKAKRRGGGGVSGRDDHRQERGGSSEMERDESNTSETPSGSGSDSTSNKLGFRQRSANQRPLPVPRLRLLGEGTREAAKVIPRINAANEKLPVIVHRFVTAPLEEGMDLLLKLYEKQLPDRSA
ncbi:hypothetical protein IAR55_006566 [Kwoniella newhampshirensis]|uniref:Csf1 N-terminal domain-containing protein n=1 Tax=Kwoniella newhampshirensis TaxID=1651941 RepID=A0AAW0YED4_9TREE